MNPAITVKVAVHAAGINFAMTDSGTPLATGQLPTADLAVFAAKLAADPNFIAVQSNTALPGATEKFSADLPTEEAAALTAQWRPPESKGSH